MFIQKKEFERLAECERLKNELEKEVQRLAELITKKTDDCEVGVWCKDCKHCGTDIAETKEALVDYGMLRWSWIKSSGGKVQYCKKHLHEICKEFEKA